MRRCGEPEPRVSVVSVDGVKSNSSEHQETPKSPSAAAGAELNPSTPRHSVRFSDSTVPPPAPLLTTAGVDVHSVPADSSNSVSALDTQRQQQAGVTGARSPPASSKQPPPVAV